MPTGYLPPSSDIVFKMLFGDEQHKDILTAFLKAALPLPDDEYAEIELQNPYLWNKPEKKVSILDIKAKTAGGKLIDIEIQVRNDHAMRERIVFYAASLLASQLGEGEAYRTLMPSICIVVADFNLLPESPGYHNRHRLCNVETQKEFSNLLQIDTLELPKLPRGEDGTPLWDWLKFLKAESKEELQMLAKRNPDVGKAIDRLAMLSSDREAHERYEAHMRARRDAAQRELDAREEGLAEGLKEGREEGLKEGQVKERQAIARNLLGMGAAASDIAQITGLSEQEITQLAAGQ
jgi:predicted transposase/invertase (TIGR01784 family)